MKVLLAPKGRAKFHVTASNGLDKMIATKLGIPLVVVEKQRKLLEKHFLDNFYAMNLTSFGYKRVDFLIATQRGLTVSVGKKLMKIKEVVYVGRSIGEPTIDLRAEVIIKGNGQLLELLEQVKAMDGVKDVVWSEIVQIVGRKGSVPPEIIDIL